VPGLSGVTQVAVGGTHDRALLEGGEVQCWGINAHGELGDHTTASRSIRGPVLF
jgi:alpha-tubulin suppressor-like RCC1 family protein